MDATRIVVVNDELIEDNFIANIYVMAAPPGISVEMVRKSEFVVKCQDESYSSGRILVLFRAIDDVLAVVREGIRFKQVQIGGLGAGGGKTSVVKGISIDRNDVQKLQEIAQTGTEITFQVTPEEPRLSLERAGRKVTK